MSDIAKHIFFRGSVQGVGFRFSANSIAKRYDLTGYVRNAPDGRVEMLLQGATLDIDDCITDLCETFHITDISSQDVPFDSSLAEFKIAF